LLGQVHHFTDFAGEDFTERATKEGGIMRENVDWAPIDFSLPGDNAIAHDLLFIEPKVVAVVDCIAI
jgi:hypothetical protein